VEPQVSERRGAGLGRYAAAALMAFGLAVLYDATDLHFGTTRQPGTGFFPTPGPQSGEEPVEASGQARVWVVIAALAVYAGLVKAAGFILCTAILLFLLLRVIGRASWAGTAIGVLSGSIGCYWIFTRLGLPLPTGLLGF
jgi:hypothetical protein